MPTADFVVTFGFDVILATNGIGGRGGFVAANMTSDLILQTDLGQPRRWSEELLLAEIVGEIDQANRRRCCVVSLLHFSGIGRQVGDSWANREYPVGQNVTDFPFPPASPLLPFRILGN